MWCWRMRRSERCSCSRRPTRSDSNESTLPRTRCLLHQGSGTVVDFLSRPAGISGGGQNFNGAAAALTSGRTHHELLLIQVGDAPGPPFGRRRGLYHIGIKVGDSLDELRVAKKDLERTGVTIDGMSDHTASQSLYLRDPDGNEVELYVDADESVWKNNPAAVVSPIKPLHL